ncbi:hypothetical protein PG988_011440 [Apiospora saccharicola]
MEYSKQPGGAYQNVAVADDGRSSTEVDESVMGDEKHWRGDATQHHHPDCHHHSHHEEESTTRKYMTKFRRYRWIVDTLLLCVNISLSLLLVRDFWREKSISTIQVGGDVTGLGPTFPTKILKFNADPAFVPNDTAKFFSNETIATWNTMLPIGSGWGEVTDETFFTTSMTHQLHCVFMMARIYSNLERNTKEHLPGDYHSHYLHCVDYLRQGIMCSGDLAMEPHDRSDSDDNGPLDGSWNGHHVCKDYDHVMPYLEEQIAEGIRKVLPIDD